MPFGLFEKHIEDLLEEEDEPEKVEGKLRETQMALLYLAIDRHIEDLQPRIVKAEQERNTTKLWALIIEAVEQKGLH